MEFSEDSIDHTLVFKGKRSKRPRQLSPDIYSSSTTSTTQISSSSSREEDEDMANCLILLAQSGQSHKQKFSSRKFTETATSTGKAGFYVYECKTCNRTFPSFQALGGHRTSHKKSKTIAAEKTSTLEDHHQQQERVAQEEGEFIKIIPSISTQIINKGNNMQSNFNSKSKIHECAICGAEFTSGQALGGHMRRHRPPTITANITNTKVTLSTTIDDTSNYTSESSHDYDEIKEKPRIILSLDLNLPAPPEDDHHSDNTKFDFSGNKQCLVFSAAALVDCHY
uniref:DNA-binding protein n=1 Tax=Petunia hybrida TaxID=4102 RepID=Q43614_PETHY|nr:DNA-binding protein [Petunia x hybrida]